MREEVHVLCWALTNVSSDYTLHPPPVPVLAQTIPSIHPQYQC